MIKETDRNKNNTIPEWQSKKMKMIISAHWQEIQHIIQAKEQYRTQFNRLVQIIKS